MRPNPTRRFVLGVALAAFGCGGDAGDGPASTESGGSTGNGGGGGTATGGGGVAATGGVADPIGGSGGGGAATGGVATGGDAATGGATVPPEPLEIEGSWLYLGPGSNGHTLAINGASIVYTAIGGEWSSRWTVSESDNGLDHFRLVLESGSGTYYPVGPNVSATYASSGAILTVQLADGLGPYPPMLSPGGCIDEASVPIADCSLYMRQD